MPKLKISKNSRQELLYFSLILLFLILLLPFQNKYLNNNTAQNNNVDSSLSQNNQEVSAQDNSLPQAPIVICNNYSEEDRVLELQYIQGTHELEAPNKFYVMYTDGTEEELTYTLNTKENTTWNIEVPEGTESIYFKLPYLNMPFFSCADEGWEHYSEFVDASLTKLGLRRGL